MKKIENSTEVKSELPTQNVISFVAKKISTKNPTFLSKNLVVILSAIIRKNIVKNGLR